MENTYNPNHIEPEIQAKWDKTQCYRVSEDPSKEKYYCLGMFPYPSGTLHMGHIRCYTLADVISRYQQMQGKNVLHPIGWDAFGLPAENAAIKHKIPPAQWTEKNIIAMRKQLKRLGNSYDWEREFSTSDPNYYRWEQWFFIQLYKKGLVYRKNALVNWDPVDQTVLANEQVIDGRGWRSGALVEHREIAQWFLKITTYAEELLAGLDHLEGWPSQVKLMQRNWIGRSEGVEVSFDVTNKEVQPLTVFTTRPDTLGGVTYLAIAIDHPLAKKIAHEHVNVANFIDECRNIQISEAEIANIEKRGIMTPLYAIHPLTQEKIPIWVANYVLMEYGAGAVMGVPAHDTRDWEFARTYNIPIKQVIVPTDGSQVNINEGAYVEKGILINSSPFNDMAFEQAFASIVEHLTRHGQGKKKTQYRLRDWGISRQRYWGTPIPMIHCSRCGIVPVPEDQLPVILPLTVEFTGAISPLQSDPVFTKTQCPQCNQDAKRETDTFDTFFESSWYYLRFACHNQDQMMLDNRVDYWVPVDYYVGGIEHAVMHLLYARFFHKALRDCGLINSDEPFKNLLTQGMILKGGVKMSKSKGNTVDPGSLINEYGADTVRLFTIFASPPQQSLEWSDQSIEGSHRFLNRLWQLAYTQRSVIKALNVEQPVNEATLDSKWEKAPEQLKALRAELFVILGQIQYDYERCQFNTIVSSSMKLLNLLSSLTNGNAYGQLLQHEGIGILLRILMPITPHICHKLWQELNYDVSFSQISWPAVKEAAVRQDFYEFVVQVNGKLRSHIKVPADAKEDTIIDTALSQETVQRLTQGKTLKKTILVKNRRLINFVVGER